MKTSDIMAKIMSQLTSGRWIVTVAATACLIKLSWTLCDLMSQGKVTLEAATYIAIIMSLLNTIGMVTVFYFQKPRTDDGNGDSTTTTTTLIP